ncbi:MAG TPA: TlpA disulfide reductase family protein [Terriglobales bacterium]|jgi:peroxiredoxin|nr:TlpA disulfide reductase family protein [Terriglobales bacterium]
MLNSRSIAFRDFRNLNLLGLLRRYVRREALEPLAAGSIAPAIELEDIEGQRRNLAESLRDGPVLAAFFKVNCITSQFTFPFLQRIHERYGGQKFRVWGISQNHLKDTREFVKKFAITFPVLLDGTGYPVSNRYGLTNSPTLFVISPSGVIQISCIGFSKADLEAIAGLAGRASGRVVTALFEEGEVVPTFKPG